MHKEIEVVASTLLGAVASAGFIRFFLVRSLNELDGVVKRIGELSERLAKFEVKVDKINSTHSLIHDIDRRLYRLENSRPGRYSNGQATEL